MKYVNADVIFPKHSPSLYVLLYESNDFDNLCKFIIHENSIRKDLFDWQIGRI